jgi:hypothetical protein
MEWRAKAGYRYLRAKYLLRSAGMERGLWVKAKTVETSMKARRERV